jgi:hypothetical protein
VPPFATTALAPGLLQPSGNIGLSIAFCIGCSFPTASWQDDSSGPFRAVKPLGKSDVEVGCWGEKVRKRAWMLSNRRWRRGSSPRWPFSAS